MLSNKKEIRKCKICKLNFEVYKKYKKIYCSKKCSNGDIEVKNKIIKSQKNTYLKKYNGKHPMQIDFVKDNFKNSMILKYGVDSALKDKNFLNKSKVTKLIRYGDINYNNVDKIKETKLKLYGSENYRNLKKSQDESYNELLNLDNFYVNFSREEYVGVIEKKYKFTCKVCDNSTEVSINNGYRPSCKFCKETGISKEELELYDFIKSIYSEKIIRNDRDLLEGKELDFYFPDLKFAIEYNGIYWHSEISGKKDKKYHSNKLDLCSKKGINLLSIFDEEWRNKKEIIKNIIKYNLNKENFEVIYARNTKIEKLNSKEKNKFLEENHLQSKDRSKFSIGLYYNNILVNVMTFIESRFDKSIEWEISRYCNKLNYIVVGGAQRLFKYFINNFSPNSVVSYCDRRFFKGNIYNKLNFSFVGNTKNNYHYIKNGKMFNRINFQKHKLKDLLYLYNEEMSEFENMKNNGYDRVWDCGNLKYIYNKMEI